MTKAAMLAAILQASGFQPGTTDAVRAELLVPAIAQESDVFGFDPLLVVALIQVESGFNQKAKNPETGAVGLLQIVRGGAVPEHLSYLNDEALMYPHRNLALGLAALSHYRDRCKSMHGWLSKFDGHKACRPSDYSRKVMKLYRELKKGAGES